MTRPATGLRRAAAVAAILAAILAALGVALKRYALGRVASKLARIEKSLAPSLRVSHGALELQLLPPALVVRDLVIRPRAGDRFEIRRLVVHSIDRAHTLPHLLDVRIEGMRAALDGSARSELARSLRALGYTAMSGDGRLTYHYDEPRQTASLMELRIRSPELGELRVHARLTGIQPSELARGDVASLRLEDLDLDYQDGSLLARTAAQVDGEAPNLRRELRAGLADVVAMFGDDALPAEHNRKALGRFLSAPGALRARVRLAAPVPAGELATDHVLSRVLGRFDLELVVPEGTEPAVTDNHLPAAGSIFERIRNYQPETATTIRTGDGQLFGHLGEEQRFPVVPTALPLYLTRAFLAAEDSAFHEHEGVDPTAVFRALLRNLRAGDVVQGGSTITQQLIKQLVVGPEKHLGRKLKEGLLALRLEQVLPKAEILRIYLDQIYFGSGAYGVEAAARVYFARAASRLSVAQAALIAGLPRAPSLNNPYRAPVAAGARQRYILQRMRELGWLHASELVNARAEKLVYRPAELGVWTTGAWYQEEVRRWLAASFAGVSGLEVRAAVDLDHQAAAEAAIALGLEEASERIGSPGASLQAALLSLDPRTGRVLAMVGGRDFHDSQFNRATQARRQAGSAFKPIVFSAALDAGYTAASVLDDEPTTFLDATTHQTWQPTNFADTYHGKVLLRTALVRSLNLATVRLADAIGVAAVRDRARALALGDLPPYLSISLGSADVTLLSLCRAYSAFARGGSWIEPQFVLSVADRTGRELYTAKPRIVEAISPANAFIVSTILKDVIRSGTATVCRSLGRPAAGKTGTSNEARDGWFIGYTPYLVTGVWVGFDDATPMGDEGVGGRVAAPIWLHYRQAIEDAYPVEDFQAPPGVVLRTVSAAAVGAAGDAETTFELPFVAEPANPADGEGKTTRFALATRAPPGDKMNVARPSSRRHRRSV